MKSEDLPLLQEQISRRQILTGAGALAVGAALGQVSGIISPAQAAGSSTEKWPWPYKKLDPATTAELCYTEWYRVFCGAVISSVFLQLRKLVGEPYISFPADGFAYFEGGQMGWGTICGAPAGANLVANLIIGPRINGGSAAGHQIATEMMEWYCQTELPVYVPKKPKVTAKLPTTVSSSPLCHISVGKWMKATNKSLASPERQDRCARVAASTAYRLVELLNAWHEGRYEADFAFDCIKQHGITGQFNCADCHSSGVPTAPKDAPKI